MKKLTPKQNQVLDFIKDYIKKHSWSPTHQIIADHFGWTKANSTEYVRILLKAGYLERTDMPYRNLIIKKGEKNEN